MSASSDSFMHLDIAPYIGQWVCIFDNKVVAHAKSFDEAYREAKKISGHKEPLIALVPSEQAIIL